jgi:(p)ppGpp synthase/HD superfamily hydrolase
MSSLEKAIQIAVQAHHGQKDKYGDPYILHPLRMMCSLEDENARVVAVLHDVVEDTDWSFDDLKKEGFGAEILDALDCVTRRDEESYEDFVNRSASNPLARRVKLADLKDNMDVRRMREVKAKDVERFEKYLRAYRKLQEVELSTKAPRQPS